MRKLLSLFLFCAACALAAGHEVAITIDDLPRGGDGPRAYAEVRALTEKLLAPIRAQKIPVTAFVIGSHGDEMGEQHFREILNLWLDAGADLGNHSASHLNINQVPLSDYEADILKGEPILHSVLDPRGRKLVYFRHPYLFTGPTPQIKADLQAFLDARDYRVAPVTFDDSDYEYALLYTHPEYRDRVNKEYIPYMESVIAFFEKRGPQVVGHEFPQILLIHANRLNADKMPELLAMFRRRGYSFVSLDHALADPAYKLPEEYAGRGGFSWIHRWSMTKKMKGAAEPDPPKWVEDGWKALGR